MTYATRITTLSYQGFDSVEHLLRRKQPQSYKQSWSKNKEVGGRHSTEVAFALLTQQGLLGSIPSVPNIVSPWNSWNFLDVAEIHQCHVECGKPVYVN